MDLGSIWNISWHFMYLNDISHAYSQVPSDNLVDVDTFVFNVGVGLWVNDQCNADSFLSLLSYRFKQLKLIS